MTKHDSKKADELIVENAPKGWQFYAHILKDTYIKIDNLNNCKFWIDDGKGWKSVSLTTIYSDNWRSKSDITELVELEKENTELQECFDVCYDELQLTRNDGDKRIAELEQDRAMSDLEQQAKGIEDFTSCCKESLDWDWSMISAYELFDMMRIRAKELREQAKQLKG